MGYICNRLNIVDAIKNENTLNQLRDLTLHYYGERDSYSGMNQMLDCYQYLMKIYPNEKINAYVVIIYNFMNRSSPLGWALMHSEDGHRFGGYGPAAKFKKELGWMYQVYVDEDHRRKGIGTILMNHCIKHFEGNIFVFDWSNDQYFKGSHFDNVKEKIHSMAAMGY